MKNNILENRNPEKIIKVCAYARVSTDSKDQLNSFENQKSFFEREIEKTGCKLTKVYADEGLTGTKLFNKPEFNQMLYDAGLDIIENKVNGKKYTYTQTSNRPPLFDEIWIKNTSRFARQTLSYEIINDLRQKNVFIRFLEQDINTKDITKDFLLKLFQVFDEQDSRDKSSKVHWGHQEGARKGIIMTNSNIYGYEYIQNENKLKIIPEEAEIIKKVFELYSEGLGIRRIINYLDKRNIKTRNGKSFSKSTISKMLSNEKYMGYSVRQKYDVGKVIIGKHYPKIKNKSEWIMQKSDKIPEIIDEELFQKCQDIRGNKVNTINQKGVNKGLTEYAGLLICSKCGKPYTANVDRGRRFYNCSNKKMHGTKACDNINISKKDLDEAVEDFCNKFSGLLKNEKRVAIDRLSLNALRLIDRLDKSNEAEINKLKNEIKEQKEILSNLNELYIMSRIQSQKEELKKRIASTEFSIESLTKNIEDLNKTNNELLNEIQEIYDRIDKLKTIEIKESYTRDEIFDQIGEIAIGQFFDQKCLFALKINSSRFFDGITVNTAIDRDMFTNKYNEEETEKLLQKYSSFMHDNVT